MDAASWSIFLNTTLQAAVHLGQDYEVNLRFVKNHLWKSVEQVFSETGRLFRDQTDITGVTTIDFQQLTWRSTRLLCSRAYQITNAKSYIFSDSVFCVGKMRDDPSAAWKNKHIEPGHPIFRASEDSESSGKPEAPDHLETMEIPVGHHTDELQ